MSKVNAGSRKMTTSEALLSFSLILFSWWSIFSLTTVSGVLGLDKYTLLSENAALLAVMLSVCWIFLTGVRELSPTPMPRYEGLWVKVIEANRPFMLLSSFVALLVSDHLVLAVVSLGLILARVLCIVKAEKRDEECKNT